MQHICPVHRRLCVMLSSECNSNVGEIIADFILLTIFFALALNSSRQVLGIIDEQFKLSSDQPQHDIHRDW